MAPNTFHHPFRTQPPRCDEPSPDSAEDQISPTKLLSLAIQKRRELYEARERDLKREILHGSVIRVLCKHLGESRSANRRNRQRRRKRRRQSKAESWSWDSWDGQGSDCSSGCESGDDLSFNGDGIDITSSPPSSVEHHHLFDYPHPEHSAHSGIQTSLSSATGGPTVLLLDQLDQLVPAEGGGARQRECANGEPLQKRLKVAEATATDGDEDLLGLRELFAVTTQYEHGKEQQEDAHGWAQVESGRVE